MPTEDVSDLRDVVDAINKLCDTMKTSYDEIECEDELVDPAQVQIIQVDTYVAETWCDPDPHPDPEPEPEPEPPLEEESAISDSDPVTVEAAQCEPLSEMYYTAASSEISLVSDSDLERGAGAVGERDDRQSVMAGHVAAMRERFETMTRANTPCPGPAAAPDLVRSISPSELYRHVSSASLEAADRS